MLSSYNHRNSGAAYGAQSESANLSGSGRMSCHGELDLPTVPSAGLQLRFRLDFFASVPVCLDRLGMLMVEWLAITLSTIAALYFLGGNQSNTNSETPAQLSVSGVAIRVGITVLRLLRILFGLVMAFQMIGLIPILSWPLNPQIVTGEAIVQVVIKLIVLALATLAFFGLRRLINRLHARTSLGGELLLRGNWSL